MHSIYVSQITCDTYAVTSKGERIREARLAAGLTQQDLAYATRVSSSSVVSRWEHDRQEPTSENVLAIAAACRVPPVYILTGDDGSQVSSYAAAWESFTAGLEAHRMELTEAEIAWLRSMRLPDGREPTPEWYLASLHSLRMLPKKRPAAASQ